MLFFSDLMSLARAAVSGDEDALDMFNWKKGGSNQQGGQPNVRISAANLGSQEATSFFLGGQSGKINSKENTKVFNKKIIPFF